MKKDYNKFNQKGKFSQLFSQSLMKFVSKMSKFKSKLTIKKLGKKK